MKSLDDFKDLLFCFHTFGVRRDIDVLDPEHQPGSGKIRTRSEALELTFCSLLSNREKNSHILRAFAKAKVPNPYTVCPRSSDPIYIVK